MNNRIKLLRSILGRVKEELIAIVPPGGKKGQALVKLSGNDFDYTWKDSGGLPIVIPSGEEYTLPDNRQSLFTKKITLEDGARLVLEGLLVEV